MSSFVLKLLACLFMLIDHVGIALFPSKIIFRIIGRLAFPMFAFQIAIGFKNTTNKIKYMKRMLIFACASQIPYAIFLKLSDIAGFKTNIGFTFFIALIVLYLIELYKKNKNILHVAMIYPLLVIGYLLHVDYSIYGILIVILFYIVELKKYPYILMPIFTILSGIYILIENSTIQLYSIFSIFILLLYNNKKGMSLKGFFYAFYPLHLIILSLLNVLLI